MKRRKFLQASLISTTLPLSAGAERLYGTPGSILPNGGATGEKFILPLSRAGVPSETLRTLAAANQLLENVLTSSDEARIFSANPEHYMQSLGLDISDKTLQDDTIIMLTTLSHPDVRNSMVRGDYEAMFGYLRVAGLFEPRDPSKLQLQIEKIMQDNIEAIRAGIQQTGSAPLSSDQKQLLLQILEESGVHATEDDLAIVSQVISPNGMTVMSCTAVAMCAVAVGIAATVVTYVSVAVAVTIGIMAAVSVSVVAHTAITVGGGGGGGGGCGSPGVFCEIQSNPFAVPFTGNFAKLDPVLMRNTERALRLGAVGGQRGVQVHALREMIAAEVRAVVSAMQKIGLLALDETQLSTATDAMTRYAYCTLGI
jgi:hypothetical protein